MIASLAGCGMTSDGTHDLGAPVAVPLDRRGPPSTRNAALVPETTARGTRIRLDGQFSSAVMAYRGADGKLTTECVDGAQAAQAMQRGMPAHSARREVQ
jgi:hypothetical protein